MHRVLRMCKFSRLVAALVVLFGLPNACFAAFAIFQTVNSATPQITCNMVTGVASVGGPCVTTPLTCNGDVQSVTRVVTIPNTPSPANRNLNVTVDTFAPGDIGKTIRIPGAGGAGSMLIVLISAFVDPQNVTLASQAFTSLSAVSTDLEFGMDDAPAFRDFNVWALANQGASQVVQTLPTGGNCWFGTQYGSGSIRWVGGVKDLVVEGGGATLNGKTVGWYAGSQAAALCQKGIAELTGCTARIKTVAAGASQLELTAASYAAGYISRFSVNQWILVAGLNPQAILNANGSGYPPNPTFFEWRQITAICNNTGPCSGTATLTLASPLTYEYLDTWPNYSSGNANEADAGGPGTIYAMNDAWNTRVEYKDLVMWTNGSLGGNGRFVTYRNVSFDGSIAQGGVNNCGSLPSQNETWAAYNTDWSYCTIESDKITNNVILDTVSVNRLDFQSSSITTATVTNSTIPTWIGTPRFTYVTDITISSLFRPGSNSYGNATQLVCTRCDVASFDQAGGVAQGTLSDYSKVGTVMEFPNSAQTGSGPPSRVWAPVGASNSNVWYVVGGSFSGTIGLVTGTALTQDATNTYVQTTDSVAFPPPFTSASGSVCCQTITAHPAPQFTCDDCSGDPIFAAMNIQRGATPLAAVGEFASRDYAPAVSAANIGALIGRGRLVSLTVNVTQAYTGSGSSVLTPTSQFSNLETVKQSDWTPWVWFPIINLKQAGIRVITPGGVTCNGSPGACAGDTINSTDGYPPEAVWVKGGISPSIGGAAFSGGVNPQFTITIQTDQGVVP